MIEITLGLNQSNQRLDKVLQRHLREAPAGFVYKMLRKKNITLNGERALGNEQTVFGDTVQFYLSEETYQKMRGEQKRQNVEDISFPEIPVLYEDNDVCIFIKPAGILSQKATEFDVSVNEWVIFRARRNGIISDSDFESFRPSVVNRLDRNTGGIMASGMSMKGLRVLSELFRDRGLGKYYFTIVSGRAPEEACEKAWIMKLPGENKSGISFTELSGSQPIETRWKRLQYDTVRDLSLLDVELVTGKRHQIRAHLSALGHPVLGDPKYGDPLVNRAFGLSFQCLFCHRISFPECALSGVSGKTFSVPAPVFWPLRPEGGES